MKKRSKEKVNKFVKGSISILLAFLLSGVLSLGALLVEGSRYQEAKKQLEESSINSALSLLAYYDSDLESRFGLYGIDSETVSADVFLNYLLFNSDAMTDGVYSANNISQLYNVTSGTYELKYDLANYQVLKRQILEYEKYRAPLNVASEMLDIDKMLKELKENIEKAIPGLESMLDVCESVADIAEALKALYCLYKDVEQLQLMIKKGGEEDLGETINTWLGQGWEAVEGLFSDEEWPSYDPSYYQAFEAFKTAVNNKVQYMKNNPAPPEPGPKPTDDVAGLKRAYENTLANYEKAVLLKDILEEASDLSYYNENSIVDANTKIEDIIGDSITEDDLKKFNLTKNSTRNDLFVKLNAEIKAILGNGSEMQKFNEDEVQRVSGLLAGKITSLNGEVQSTYSAYDAANRKLQNWEAKKQKYDEYNQAISSYNTTINEKKTALSTVIGNVSKELGNYKSSLTDMTSAIDSANEALETINKVNNKDTSVDTDKAADIFTEIKSQILLVEEAKPDKGIQFLNEQKEKLNNLNVDSITASYNFDAEFTTGQLLDDNVYYMTKGAATLYCTEIAAVNLLQGMAEIIDIIKAMWGLIEIVQPLPYAHELGCVVELNDSTASILPSRINGGAGTTEVADSDDISEISAMLDEARDLLGSAYNSDINSVDPNNRLQEAELTAEISNRITRLSTNLASLTGSGDANNLFVNTNWLFVSTVFRLLNLIPTLIEIIEDLTFIGQRIEEAIQIIISSLGESLLINQYIVDEFPNRTTDKNDDNNNEEIKGWHGESRTWFPDNTKPVQTFSGAQVEYVIGGSTSEKTNQRQCFWSIFAIRALNNIFAVIGSDAMSIISACNIAAPLVFILWVYLESNLDMNLLLKDKEVPLIKTQIILSKAGLTNTWNSVKSAFKDIKKEDVGADELSFAAMKIDYVVEAISKNIPGLFKMKYKMKYKDYLWFFLFFTPNQTKVMRTADLIQMEMRYKDYYYDGKGLKFELQNLHTYVRCEAEGTFNSILPVISLSDNTLNGRGFKVRCVKYVGY